jgi:hypothetical protein
MSNRPCAFLIEQELRTQLPQQQQLSLNAQATSPASSANYVALQAHEIRTAVKVAYNNLVKA